MRFSVLTPSFNYAQYLGMAIASVSGQAGDPEHVVMDGGSTDSTRHLLESAPSNVRWRSEPDRGQSDALNKALDMATGDIIGWLNADDYYLAGAFEAVAAVFARHPEVDVVHGDCVFVDADQRFVRLGAGYPTSRRVLANRGCVIPSTASFFRRSALGHAPWNADLRVVMDWDLFLRLIADGRRFKYLPLPLAGFRLHEAQVTHDLSDRNSPEHRIVRERWGAAPRHARWARRAGDLEHRMRKVATGAKYRELRAARHVGQEVLVGTPWPPAPARDRDGTTP